MASNDPHWHVPFKGRNVSLATAQNFLWQHENVYVMDNHRAAMWCWLREVEDAEVVGLLHIDEHYDTLYSRMPEWLSNLPELRGMSIGDYLGLTYRVGRDVLPVIQWDNYLSIFLERYPDQVGRFVFATLDVGDKPKLDDALHPRPWSLPSNLADWLQDTDLRWIVNVDLDFFFCGDEHGNRRLMFSDEYIEAVFHTIRAHREAGRVACLTLCLTPDEDYTGGWAQAEALCARACNILGVPFSLPPDPDALPRGHYGK